MGSADSHSLKKVLICDTVMGPVETWPLTNQRNMTVSVIWALEEDFGAGVTCLEILGQKLNFCQFLRELFPPSADM